MTLSSSPSSTLSFVETYDWDLSETEKSRALWIKLHTIWFLIIYQPRNYRPLVWSIGGKLRGPTPRFLRLWWASPVYHSRRGFRSTPFAALIKGNREITTTSPPPPPCKLLDGFILLEHNLAVLLLNSLYCCGYFLYMGYVDRQLLYLLSYSHCHDDSYGYGYFLCIEILVVFW